VILCVKNKIHKQQRWWLVLLASVAVWFVFPPGRLHYLKKKGAIQPTSDWRSRSSTAEVLVVLSLPFDHHAGL
jgi:hypothetical protein